MGAVICCLALEKNYAQTDLTNRETDQSMNLSDEDFNNLKNPFINQLPSPTPPPVAPPPSNVSNKKTNLKNNKTSTKGHEKSAAKKEINPPDLKPPSFTINGIVWDTDMPQAIVNSKIVGIGDVVDDSKVVNINEFGIEVLFKGKRFKVTYK